MTVLAVPEIWTFGGYNFSTYAALVESVLGADVMPSPRGSDWARAGQHGQFYLEKPYDARKITLLIWVLPRDASNGITGTDRAQARANLDALYTIFGMSGQQALTRTMPDGSVRQVLAKAYVSNINDPVSGELLGLTVDFICADPFWYSALTAGSTTTVNTSPKALTVNNAGSFITNHFQWHLVGTFTNPRIDNQTNGEFLALSPLVMAAAKILDIDCYAGTVVYDGTDVSALLTHGGSRNLMDLNPGNNTISVTTAVTGGTIRPSIASAWL